MVFIELYLGIMFRIFFVALAVLRALQIIIGSISVAMRRAVQVSLMSGNTFASIVHSEAKTFIHANGH